MTPLETKPVDAKVQALLEQITAARRREQDWRKEGRRVLEIYGGKKKDQIPFNILYSNTETMLPALYNAQPRPVVQRRFKDADPIGKASSLAGQRTLEFVVDTNNEEYASFDEVMVDCVVDGLLPGRGSMRVKYDAKIVGQSPNRYVAWELVCFESLKWDRWVFGYAKKWTKVPWIAFEHDVTEEEAIRLFGSAIAGKLQYTASEKSNTSDKDEDSDDTQTNEDRKICKVWEVWVREGRKVIHVSPNYTDGLLKEEADPLGLTGFFPLPEPMRFLRKSNDLMPVAPYTLYENQAKELNRLSTRINRVAEAIKVRGAYDSTITELDDLLKKDDNQMVGAQNVAALTDGGLEKAIWLMPIDKLIAVLQQLYIARQACKQVIYEITGISDILRGSTVASETATAQELKSQWGTLRLKRLQREVQRFARDALRISLEIASKRFSEKTFAAMTGLPFATTPEVQAAQGQVAAARSMFAVQGVPQQALPQMLQQAVPEALATLAKPHWDAVMKMLRDNTQRAYRIDIETNSTVDVEATEDQKQMSEVLQAVSQFIQGVAPLIQSGSMPFEVAQSMLLGIVRRYRMGSEIEDYIKAMKPPADPNEGKMKAEQAKAAAEEQRAQKDHDLKMKEGEAKLKFKEQEAGLKLELEREKMLLEKEKLELEREKIRMELQKMREEAAIRVAEAHAMPDKKQEPANAPA